MAEKIKDLIGAMISGFLDEKELELYAVQFVKEGKSRFLRVYIDKKESAEEEYVSIGDCELVSRYLSQKLDEADPIGQEYFLEVSSPGMDRELLEPGHFSRYEGRAVEIRLYESVDGAKFYSGILVGLIDGKIVIRDEKGGERAFPSEQVAKASLAVVF